MSRARVFYFRNRVSPASATVAIAANSRSFSGERRVPKVNLRNREVCARFPRAKVAVRNRGKSTYRAPGTLATALLPGLLSSASLGKTYYNNLFVCMSAVIAIISTSRSSRRPRRERYHHDYVFAQWERERERERRVFALHREQWF